MRLVRKRWIFLVWVLLLALTGCRQVRNYSEQDELYFEDSYAEGDRTFSGSIKVVSWNTNYAEQLDQIIEAFTEEESLRDADVLLLQEMDEVSLDLLAQALKYNYVYYPATIHHHHDKNFGNAILSPWPLENPKKILLPNSDPDSKQDRIAVRADVLMDNIKLAAYSVHLDHFWMLPSRSDSQVEVLINEVAKDTHPIIIGGDFNTWVPGSIELLDQRFGEIGIHRVSRGAGPTLEVIEGVNLETDHIYGSDFFAFQTGVWEDFEVSDHSAVWANLSLE